MLILRVVMLSVALAGRPLPVVAAKPEPLVRRPVALAISSNGKWLYTANRDSGSISVIDTSTRSVAAETEIGGRLTDLVLRDDGHLLTLDEEHHRLVLLTGSATEWSVASSLDMAHYPVRLRLSQDRHRCFVASLWSRTITCVDLTDDDASQPRLRSVRQLQLPFEPREMCLTLDGQKLIVAGSFQGMLAVVDTDTLKLLAQHEIPGHNIRGLAISGDGRRLLIAHQELNPLARATRDDVHWGNMISNLMVSLSVDDVSDSAANVLENRIVRYPGEPGNAAGDPGRIITASGGSIAVLLSGVDEIAIGAVGNGYHFHRVPVGRRPVAAVSTSNGSFFVANIFSDSISMVEASDSKQSVEIPLGPQPRLNPAQLGERLFFDSRLSHDGWMSCHSCHTDGHTNGQLNDNLSDGSFGAPKRVLSLLGVAETGPWAWNGQAMSLEEQTTSSIEKTMQGTVQSDEHVAALVAYLKTLSRPVVRSDAADLQDADSIRRGKDLFQSLNCQRCHAPPAFTCAGVYDVGLKDSVGNRKFNPPSLRGVGWRVSLFHDGRSDSLEDVFLKHRHQLNRELTTEEVTALVVFLKTL